MKTKNEEIFTLHRYFVWSCLMKMRFEDLLKKHPQFKGQPDRFGPDLFLYMSHWYASLYVVIEGWQELKLEDQKIDALLKSENVKLLKRYRHGTYHFQKSYFDNRVNDFMINAQDPVEWIRTLHHALSNWFLKWLEKRKKFT